MDGSAAHFTTDQLQKTATSKLKLSNNNCKTYESIGTQSEKWRRRRGARCTTPMTEEDPSSSEDEREEGEVLRSNEERAARRTRCRGKTADVRDAHANMVDLLYHVTTDHDGEQTYGKPRAQLGLTMRDFGLTLAQS